jgi:serine/threonine protein phosphatase PrpC
VSTSLPYRAAAITDVGLVRRQNEDRFVCDPGQDLFGVADGVGGLPAGARAAQIAIDTLTRKFSADTINLAADWRPTIEAANDAVVAAGKLRSRERGIATTLTAGTIRHDQLIIAHIGDSRCLLLRAGETRCLTTDHSVENEAKRDPSMPPPAERWRLALARCLGHPAAIKPDFLCESVQAGDRVVFATDGITRVISDAELLDTLGTSKMLEERLADLIDLVYTRGAPDNATAVVIEFSDSSHD